VHVDWSRVPPETIARALVYAVFLYTCIEGLVINICYPSLLPYLYRDLGIAAVYALVFLTKPRRLFPAAAHALWLPLIVFFATTISYLSIPTLGLMVGIIGLKQKLFYIPLIGIGFFLVRNTRDLHRFLTVLVVCAIPVSLFGIYLHFAGPGFLRQLGANYSTIIHTAPYGEGGITYWRVPGTFTSPGQFGSYLLFNGVIAAGLMLSKGISGTWRLIAGISLTLIILAMFGTGSRGPFLLLAACICATVAFSHSFRRITIIVFTTCVALTLGLGYLGTGVKSRFSSIIDYEHIDRFERTYFGQLFVPALASNPLGAGLGVATVGARHFVSLDKMQLVESYLGVLAVEMGVPGLLVGSWLLVAIVFSVLRGWRHVGGSPVAVIWYGLAAYVLVIVAIVPVSAAIEYSPTNSYFWLALGLVFRLPEPLGRT
jgi:hypothetical protein